MENGGSGNQESTTRGTACGEPFGIAQEGPVEPLSADDLARLWSGFSPVTGGVPSDLAHTQHAKP
jgi:hypothetical protein